MKRPSLFQMFVYVALMKVPFSRLRDCLRRIERHGLDLSHEKLVAHHLAGGRITSLADGLIYAQEHGVKLSTMQAAARDLASKYSSGISLTEHILALERAGYRDLDSAPIDPAHLKHT